MLILKTPIIRRIIRIGDRERERGCTAYGCSVGSGLCFSLHRVLFGNLRRMYIITYLLRRENGGIFAYYSIQYLRARRLTLTRIAC